MRLAFMGTGAFAVPSLDRLHAIGCEVAAVFSQPDRPSGRGRKIHFSPVKEAALSLKLELHQPESLKSENSRDLMERLAVELIVVVSYGKILPSWLVHLPSHGVVNVHGSLLPKYRGAAPINWAIANGESRTGVCTMQIDEGMDTGPLYLCRDTRIGPDETAPELSARLAVLGADVLAQTLESIERETIRPTPQDEDAATLAPRLEKADGYIRWNEAAQAIHNKIRGFLPWPSVVVAFRGKRCRLLGSRLPERIHAGGEPGAILYEKERLMACCGDGNWLEIEQLQMENKNVVSGVQFANGVRLASHEAFGSICGP